MNFSINLLFIILLMLVFIDVLLIFFIYLNKIGSRRFTQKAEKIRSKLISGFENISPDFIKKNLNIFLNEYIQMKQSLILSERNTSKVVDILKKLGIISGLLKGLKSFSKIKRIESSALLGFFPGDEIRLALEKALLRESDHIVKLYIVDSLVNLKYSQSIRIIIESMTGSPEWYYEKASIMLFEYGEDLYAALPDFFQRTEKEVHTLIINFASKYIAQDLRRYLLKKSRSTDEELAVKAVEALSKDYYKDLEDPFYLNHKNYKIRNIALASLSRTFSKQSINKLIEFLDDPDSKKYAIFSISNILKNEPKFIPFVLEKFKMEKDENKINAFATILSNRIEYFLNNIVLKEKETVKMLIYDLISIGKKSEIIGFLNKNKNLDIENEILPIIKFAIKNNKDVELEFRTYLNERLLSKLKFEKIEQTPVMREEKRERNKIKFLYILLSSTILIFPLIFIIHRHNLFSIIIYTELIKVYILDFNYYLIFYSALINIFYVLLLILSFLGISEQIRYWKIKRMSFLYKKGILPSISIIAPAYCEEATIIESTNSLLNLNYPDYELIVVNDGSKDNTLSILINYYGLERVDYFIEQKINTKPIRGIYLNKSYPNLIVVDKANGGKADSLNAGINVSKKEYFCGIDADSLLEPDALLKIASLKLDTEEESVAMGGNIFPINGCKVNKGFLTDIKIPKNNIARFQTIEYIRAFLAGRIGWAYLNSLLIISGAFGLFKKDRIILIGGYLTSSGIYKKDTVGEDMELVVRLSRYMREKNIKHKINYSFNANCWTEVPESFKVLYRQRDRWHRGLIDILAFHKKIIFNYKYSSMGLLSIPYFLLFEVIGPLVEFQGYFMIILAFIFGMMNIKIALLLFISTILLGTLTSVASILLAEKNVKRFSFKEVLILIFYGIIENFGFRQVMSFIRVTGYINSLRKPKGWGKMVRKGFSSK